MNRGRKRGTGSGKIKLRFAEGDDCFSGMEKQVWREVLLGNHLLATRNGRDGADGMLYLLYLCTYITFGFVLDFDGSRRSACLSQVQS